jgi:hypothetical protein
MRLAPVRIGGLVLLCASGCASYAREHFAHRTVGRDLDEARALAEEVGALASAGRADELAARVDGEAEKALLVLLAEQAYEQSPRIQQTVDFVEDAAFLMAAASVLTRGKVLSDEDLRRGVAWAMGQIGDAVRAERKTGGSPLSLLDGLGAELAGTPAERAQSLAGSLVEVRLVDCHFERAIASYRLWLLGHRDWGCAESSRTFRDWKAKVDRGALVVDRCQGARLVLLLTANRREPLRAAGWRHFSDDEWPSIEPRLDGLAHIGQSR